MVLGKLDPHSLNLNPYPMPYIHTYKFKVIKDQNIRAKSIKLIGENTRNKSIIQFKIEQTFLQSNNTNGR